MPAANINLRLDQATRFVWEHELHVGGADGPLMQLAGYSARMQVRPELESSTVLAELTTANGAISLGTTNGRLAVTFTAAMTAGAAWVEGVYDLELVQPDGLPIRLFRGDITIDLKVTRMGSGL